MPVEQRDPRQTLKAVLLGVAAVAASVGFLVLVLWFTDRGSVEIALGDDVFEAGRTTVLTGLIAEDGPILYADLLGGSQNIILQHIGTDPELNWYAFDLFRPGQPPECPLEWQPDARVFRDACDETIEVPAAGGSQRSYPIEIIDGEVVIDFRAEAPTE